MDATLFEDDLRATLIARRGEWGAIAQHHGLSYSWLSKFANNRIPNPGYRTLLALQVALAAPRSTEPQPDERGAAPARAAEKEGA